MIEEDVTQRVLFAVLVRLGLFYFRGHQSLCDGLFYRVSSGKEKGELKND